MLNRLPEHICMIPSCSVDKFKSQLDKHLKNIADLPCHTTTVWMVQMPKWRSLRRCPGYQLDAAKQDQVNQVIYRPMHSYTLI